MSDDRNHLHGLTRRELERELNWMLRNPPSDSAQLIKLLGQVIVTLIDKNNAALAKRAAHHDDDKPGAP